MFQVIIIHFTTGPSIIDLKLTQRLHFLFFYPYYLSFYEAAKCVLAFKWVSWKEEEQI